MLLLLSGCALLSGVAPVNLKNVDVVEVRATLVDGSGACPGNGVPLVLVAVAADGTEYSTQPTGEQKPVRPQNFDVQGNGVRYDPSSGLLVVPADPGALWNAQGLATVTTAYHPQVQATVKVPVRYNCSYTANFSGDSGREGASGSMGSSGDHGVDKQSSESYAEPGGHGQDGGHGGDGVDGEPGRPGDEVVVQADLIEHPDGPLILVVVESRSTNQSSRYVVAPGSTVTVTADGGSGGRGGNGGNGGSGGSGGTGAPPGNGGDGGDGGHGGNGADGADGGTVTVVLDPEVAKLGDPIEVVNRGGAGGQPGSAGAGGTGGNSFSGAEAGESGSMGQAGSRAGRDGRPGPKVQVSEKALNLKL